TPAGPADCCLAPVGSTTPRSSCGRGMPCTPTTSPTRAAAAAPASMAALTAATSPTTSAVTMPLPIFCQPISVTFADFSIASAASTRGTSPFVSIMPNASRLLLAMNDSHQDQVERIAAPRGLLEQFKSGRPGIVDRVALVRVDVNLQLAARRVPHQQALQHRAAVALDAQVQPVAVLDAVQG